MIIATETKMRLDTRPKNKRLPMKPELRELIDAYCAKAAELIPRLAEALGFKLPITNTEWVCFDVPNPRPTCNGLQYFKHGFGVAIKFDGGAIDIDFGDNGEYNGFDADRLFRFATASGFPTPYKDYREVEADIKEAVAKGQLRYSGYILYYLTNDE